MVPVELYSEVEFNDEPLDEPEPDSLGSSLAAAPVALASEVFEAFDEVLDSFDDDSFSDDDSLSALFWLADWVAVASAPAASDCCSV